MRYSIPTTHGKSSGLRHARLSFTAWVCVGLSRKKLSPGGLITSQRGFEPPAKSDTGCIAPLNACPKNQNMEVKDE
ncbi:MAG: hypothetical protein N2166_06735 [candidate division WOR-3 bacterium]|nr:hypothetical protein [candidate division WOR-3 bacterium]